MPDYLVPLPEGHDPFADQHSANSPAEEAAYHRGFFHGATGARGSGWPAMIPADPRYQMAPSEAEQAQRARETAAYRGRNAVAPEEGRGESGFTDAAINMFPGVGAVRQAAGGDYAGAAESAALGALPFGAGAVGRYAIPAAAAVAGGLAMSPEATGGGLFDQLPKTERPAWEARLKEAKAIESPKRRDAAVSAVMTDFQGTITDRGKQADREAKDTGAYEAWKTQNAATVASLPKTWRDRITGATTLPEAKDLFGRAMEARSEGSKTLAERYPGLAAGVEGAGLAASIGVPMYSSMRRTAALKKAADEAEAAYLAAYGPGAKVNAGAKNAAALKSSVLGTVGGMPRFNKYEIAGGALAPGFISNVPNAYDMIMGTLSSDPVAGEEKVRKALGNVTDPVQLGRNVVEGIGGPLVGGWLGTGIRDFDLARSRATGIINAVSSAEKTAADKTAATAAKAAATRAANRANSQNTGVLTAPPAAAPKPRSRSKQKP
jgi:hypothetical protein